MAVAETRNRHAQVIAPHWCRYDVKKKTETERKKENIHMRSGQGSPLR